MKKKIAAYIESEIISKSKEQIKDYIDSDEPGCCTIEEVIMQVYGDIDEMGIKIPYKKWDEILLTVENNLHKQGWKFNLIKK
jgi:transcriptional regulator